MHGVGIAIGLLLVLSGLAVIFWRNDARREEERRWDRLRKQSLKGTEW